MTEDRKQEDLKPEAALEGGPGAEKETQEAEPETEESAEALRQEVGRLEAEVQRLEGEVARLTRERDEIADLARRLRADFDNFRRRTREEAAELRLTAAAEVVRDLLPVLDNLERALAAAGQEGGGEALRQGVALTRDQFFATLVAAGLEPVPAVGRRFDPTLHEALERTEEVPGPDSAGQRETAAETAPPDGVPEFEVVEEFRRGYLLRGKLLRPSLVKVAPKVRRD
ncbi:MAG TPA: nucleotide exchange factor GrpE [Firmicutes bacterium]|nr:nucleotide exchange factor GrpE [Bacillota bacterium]